MFIYASPKTMKVTINQSKCMHSSETKCFKIQIVFFSLFHLKTMEWTPLLYYAFQDYFIKHKPLISEEYYMSICRFL